jgi:hypothetical protein
MKKNAAFKIFEFFFKYKWVRLELRKGEAHDKTFAFRFNYLMG